MVENSLSEMAVIFRRVPSEYDMTEKFIPVKVVEGFYYEQDDYFIDSEQNVYPHMASIIDYGNVYAGRSNIIEALKTNGNLSFTKLKKRILANLSKYEFFKDTDKTSDSFNIIKTINKETGEVSNFNDVDTDWHYQILNETKNFMNNARKEEKQEKVTKNNVSIEEKDNIEEEKYTITPEDIISMVKRTIKGQDEAIEKIATLIWIRYNIPTINKTNMLVLGPSGCGKTAIFKKIKKVLNVPLSIYSVTGTSQAGYRGHDIEEMLAQLYYDANMDIEKAENGIVIIDEFDKLADNRDNGELGTVAIQNELLKLIEGCERTIYLDDRHSINMDTSNIIFVACGAFSHLYENNEKKINQIGFGNIETDNNTKDKTTVEPETIITKGGIIRELVGRLPIIIEVNDLNNNREVLKDILLNSDESGLNQIIESLNSLGITIENMDTITDALIDDAIKKKVGARGLTSSMINMFIKIFKKIGNNPGKYNKLIIGPNIVNDYNDYELVLRKTKTRKRTINK